MSNHGLASWSVGGSGGIRESLSKVSLGCSVLLAVDLLSFRGEVGGIKLGNSSKLKVTVKIEATQMATWLNMLCDFGANLLLNAL
jgi:hypothetical protein